MAKVVQLIYTEERHGRGVEADPVRLLQQLWTLDGRCVVSVDPTDSVLTRCDGDALRAVGQAS